jgi:hypothetical protein
VSCWTARLLAHPPPLDGSFAVMMIVLFIVLARNKLRIPLEGTYSREM